MIDMILFDCNYSVVVGRLRRCVLADLSVDG
jgi:hypothetical protein